MLGVSPIEAYRACWVTSLGLMRRRHLFVPFLLIFAVKIIPLLLVFWYWHPAISSFMTPIIRSLAGEELLHYPEHIRSLPDVFYSMEIVAMLVVGFVMLGWAVFLMVDTIQGHRYRAVKYGGQIAILVPQILLIGFVFVLGVLGVPYLFGWIADQIDHPKLQLLLIGAGHLGGFGAQVLLIYSLFFLLQAGGRAFLAMKSSAIFARENMGVTVAVVATAVLLPTPFRILAGDVGAHLSKLQGELVLVYLILGAAVEVFAYFVLIASTSWIGISAIDQK